MAHLSLGALPLGVAAFAAFTQLIKTLHKNNREEGLVTGAKLLKKNLLDNLIKGDGGRLYFDANKLPQFNDWRDIYHFTETDWNFVITATGNINFINVN